MNRYSCFSGALVLAALLSLDPSVAWAEPGRNANIWNWRDHEPVPSEVQKEEQAAGIVPSSQQEDDRELESICRKLLNAPCNLSRSANGAG
jgi:hypothetical protein